jgi:anti-anti-sigma regulatory factor
MFLADVDKEQGLLTIRFSGQVDAAQACECLERLQHLLSGIRPDFGVLTDLTGLESMDAGCVPFIREMMDLCNARGALAVVRVIPDPRKDIGFGVLTPFHYDASVRIVTCETLEQAAKLLSLALRARQPRADTGRRL